MEKVLVIKDTALLCIFLSLLLLNPTFSLQVNAENNSSVTSLPRKLKGIQEQEARTQESMESKMKARGTINTGALQHKEVAKSKSNKEEKRGEREWEEEIDPSELLTMDYHNIRRRRPIHNKSLPVGP